MVEEYEPRESAARTSTASGRVRRLADAFHITAPSEDGDGAFARCATRCATPRSIRPASTASTHGTSTPLGDIAETIAVKRALGDHAKKVAVNSTKSMTGHLLGAAGAVEAIFTVLALRDQVSPPTINLQNQDPQCDLDYVPNAARKMRIRAALSNSFARDERHLVFADLSRVDATLRLDRPRGAWHP